MKTIGLFVDVQNIYYTCRDTYAKQFNYRALLAELNARGTVTILNAYAIARDQDDQIRFQDALRHMGFEVKLKPFIQRSDGSAKGDWDVGITLDVVDSAASLDEIVLLSGDGDFSLLLNYVQSRFNTHCCVYGVAALTAKALSDQADVFIPITTELLR